MSTMIEVKNLAKYFAAKKGIIEVLKRKKGRYVKAVDRISFHVKEKEMLGLVGESGCGKTTTGKLLLRLVDPTSGEILFKGEDALSFDGRMMKKFRRSVQSIFQDPYGSLNPKMRIYNLLAEPLEIYNIASNNAEKMRIIKENLETVQLTPPENYLYKYPSMLSGGQLQRVAIARALLMQPEFIVADEPVSMLDVSVRGSVLNLLVALRNKFSLSGVFVTHDLAIAKYMCDRIAVMYLGKIVEIGPAEEIIDEPIHPYTKALLAVVPTVQALNKPYKKVEEVIRGGVPQSAETLPNGCRFHPRCISANEDCKKCEPELFEAKPNHQVACYIK